MVIKNKKAIGFPILIALFLFVLFFLSLIFIVSPMDNIKENIDFSLTKEVDKLIMLKPAQDFYQKSELSNVYLNSRQTFTQSINLGQTALDLGLLDPQKLIICDLKDLKLWYNEIGIELSDKNNVYENCLPEFGDVDTQYKDYLKNELSSNINQEGFSNIEILEKEDSKKLLIKITNSPNTKAKYSQVYDDYIIEKEVEVSYFTSLLKVLVKIIPNLSDEFKTKVPVCVLENDNLAEIDCINKVLSDLIYEEDSNLKNEYEFKLKLIDEVLDKTEDKYFGLQIDVYNKIEESKDLSFGLILKDTIPYAPLNFEVENSKSLNNFINVLIEKPAFEKEVNKYLVMYSYQDFLSTAHPKNLDFIKMLEKGEIPTNMITDTNLNDHNSNKYFYSTNLDLTVILSSNGGFEKMDNNDIQIKKVPIYQIFSNDKKEFELIEKPVYVYVFAIDINNNLFVNEIENKAKIGYLNNNLGPMPPLKEKTNILGEIVDLENSIKFTIKEYNDVNFNHFDIYILDKKLNSQVKLTKNCEEQNEGCYYFNGAGFLTKDKFNELGDFNCLITSMSEQINFPNIITTNQFTPNFNFENNKNYDIYIIPENHDNIGYMQDFSIKKFKINDEKLKFQVLDSSFTQFPLLYFKDVKIIDKKAPNLDSIELLEPNFNLVGNNLYLQWKSAKENDVKELEFLGTIWTNDGGSIGPNKILVGNDGKTIVWNDNFNRIELNGIIIKDFSNNIYENKDFKLTYPQIISE